jgi:hypothetical protein
MNVSMLIFVSFCGKPLRSRLPGRLVDLPV